MSRRKRGAGLPGPDAEAQAAEELFWLSRFLMASEQGTAAGQIHLQIREHLAQREEETAIERLASAWAFISALGATEGARRWVATCARTQQRVAGLGPGGG